MKHTDGVWSFTLKKKSVTERRTLSKENRGRNIFKAFPCVPCHSSHRNRVLHVDRCAEYRTYKSSLVRILFKKKK